MKQLLVFFGVLLFILLLPGCATQTVYRIPRDEMIYNLLSAYSNGCVIGQWDKAGYCPHEDKTCQDEIRNRCDRLKDSYEGYLEDALPKE